MMAASTTERLRKSFTGFRILAARGQASLDLLVGEDKPAQDDVKAHIQTGGEGEAAENVRGEDLACQHFVDDLEGAVIREGDEEGSG
jgi:hypothetical protein